MPRQHWTREELIVAFNLYCKIPFGKIHRGNPQIIELSRVIGRSPSAVSWKLANFARLDPTLQKRHIAGASHGAKADVAIWDEFKSNWERLAFESELLLQGMAGKTAEPLKDMEIFPEGRSREAVVRTRVNQGFFRAAVLAAYDCKCCITGLSIPQLLNASHIVPWVVDVKNRTNPRNGLCLNAVHDRAFDSGLLTITPNLKVKISPKVRKRPVDVINQELFWKYEDTAIALPHRFLPDASFLKYHNDKVFVSR